MTDIVEDQGRFHMVIGHVDLNLAKGLEGKHHPTEMQNCVQHVDRGLPLDGHGPSPGVVHGPKVLKKWQK